MALLLLLLLLLFILELKFLDFIFNNFPSRIRSSETKNNVLTSSTNLIKLKSPDLT